MADAEDPHRTVPQSEQQAIVALTQAEGAGQIAVECFDVAGAGAGKPENAVEQQHRGGAVNGADIIAQGRPAGGITGSLPV